MTNTSVDQKHVLYHLYFRNEINKTNNIVFSFSKLNYLITKESQNGINTNKYM